MSLAHHFIDRESQIQETHISGTRLYKILTPGLLSRLGNSSVIRKHFMFRYTSVSILQYKNSTNGLPTLLFVLSLYRSISSTKSHQQIKVVAFCPLGLKVKSHLLNFLNHLRSLPVFSPSELQGQTAWMKPNQKPSRIWSAEGLTTHSSSWRSPSSRSSLPLGVQSIPSLKTSYD